MPLESAVRRAALAALLLASAALCCALEAGDAAPKFANPDLRGDYVRYQGVIGTKWVIINFFATWCGPCKEEIPSLEALQREVGAERLQVIVFATDKEKESVREYFERNPTNLTIVLDPYQVTYQRYNPGEDSLPTIFLVNPQGTIELRHVGYSPEFIDRVRAVVLREK